MVMGRDACAVLRCCWVVYVTLSHVPSCPIPPKACERLPTLGLVPRKRSLGRIARPEVFVDLTPCGTTGEFGELAGDSGNDHAERMNSVTEKKQRRRSVLTNDVMAGIPALVQQGLNAEAIAARLGCNVGTLRVRCSQALISLRVPKKVNVVRLVPAPKPPKQEWSHALALPTTLQLSPVAMSRLRQRAEATGMTEAQLASDLLEMIAQDDLYDAVLDRTKDA